MIEWLHVVRLVCIFSRGFGQKKIDLILKTEPKILTEVISIEEKINKLKNIEGLGDKTSRAFAEKIKDFMIFIKEAKLEYKLDEKVSSEKVSSNKVSSNKVLSNKIIVLSDLKDKKGITEKIVELGGEVVGNINKSVNLLVVGDIDTETGKMKKAKEYNISIISIFMLTWAQIFEFLAEPDLARFLPKTETGSGEEAP